MEKEVKELEATVKSQKEQLTRYETRLKDVVAAYKGLLKEKEALEASFAAVSATKSSPEHTATNIQSSSSKNGADGQEEDLQVQIATLMNSLATLSAEKSRQEASFQADKRQLRQELAAKDKIIRDLQEKVKTTDSRHNTEVEAIKSKLIVEKHERDKEAQDHMVMVRELQKLLADERHLKESLEMQLNNLKGQFTQMNAPDKVIRELNNELEVTKKALKQIESQRKSTKNESADAFFAQLQEEMQNLKQQHAVAIRNEQKRALMAEETNRRLAALHEERVASLEARLSELSGTVGSYDRLRQQDQENIMKLKEKLVKLTALAKPSLEEERRRDVHGIVEEILTLKKKLIQENAVAEHPVDVGKIFITSETSIPRDLVPLSDYQKLKGENDRLLEENDSVRFSLEEQKAHIRTLQEKVKVLNRNIEEHENEQKSKNHELAQILKAEKAKWREAIAQIENEYRSRVAQLETELQKQRERSIQLLDEKEKEIKTLKTSFEIFIPGNTQIMNSVQDSSNQPPESQMHLSQILNPGNGGNASSNTQEFHMLHYAHELARKDVEIVNLRKSKYSTETALRQALQEKVTIQEQLHDKISNLEDEVDRLNRYKSREGANLEYLKNVILSYLVSKDPDSRKHMLNAIGAVLKFSPAEINSISTFLSGKK